MKAVYETGTINARLDGARVRVYSVEKALAECFKYLDKLDIDVCVGALKLYRRRGRIKMNQIEQYAKVCRVERVMRPYLEAVLRRFRRLRTWAHRSVSGC